MYLGRMRCLRQDVTYDVELRNRMAKGWAKLARYKAELTNRHYSLKQLMRVFTSVIQTSVLYGRVSWKMTAPRVAILRTTRRRMLWQMISTRRSVEVDPYGNETLENYAGWIHCEQHAQLSNGCLCTMIPIRWRRVAGDNSDGWGMFAAALTNDGQCKF